MTAIDTPNGATMPTVEPATIATPAPAIATTAPEPAANIMVTLATAETHPVTAGYPLIGKLTPHQQAFVKAAHFHRSLAYIWISNRWVGLSTSNLATLLHQLGFAECEQAAKALAREAVLQAMLERPLSYVGELAGFTQGVHETPHGRVLVPVGFRLIDGREGAWTAIDCYLRSLLGDEQLLRFMANLKVAREILRSGSRRTITVQFFVGPPGCGKSVALRLITAALGGRAANGFRFLSAATDFNSDLVGVIVLLIDDNLPKGAHRACVRMVARIKEVQGGAVHRVEGKGKDSFAASLTQFIGGAINENPDAIRVIPRLTDDFADKITLYFCAKGVLPATKATGGALLCETLTAELPAFLHAVDTMEIPADLHDDRYGVKAWHSPEVLARLNEADPVKILMGILALLPVRENGEIFVGRSAELHEKLLDDASTRHDYGEFARVHLGLATPIQHLGELLNSAAETCSDRVQSAPMRNGHRCWRVLPQVAPVAPMEDLAVNPAREDAAHV